MQLPLGKGWEHDQLKIKKEGEKCKQTNGHQ